MTAPTVAVGTKLLILVGDGATPEVFSQPCGLTTRNFDIAASTNSTLIPDCDDPEAAAWEAKDVNALSATISGSGVMAVESAAIWRNWIMSGVSKNIQIKFDVAGMGYFAGSFIITSSKWGGVRGQKITIDVTMVNDGALTWTDVP